MSSVGTRLSLLSAETLIQARQGPVASPSPRPRRSGRGPRCAAGRVAGRGMPDPRSDVHTRLTGSIFQFVCYYTP